MPKRIFQLALLLLVFALLPTGSRAAAPSADRGPQKTVVLVPINDHFQEFVRTVQRKQPEKPNQFELYDTLFRAALLFDALGAYGVRYEPSSHKSDFFKRLACEDSVYLIPPTEVFETGKGSAQSLSLLLIGVLEAAGIQTALLEVKRHPLVMFDTRIHKRYAGVLSRNLMAYSIRNNRVWMALEPTALGEPFHEAWEKTYGKLRGKPLDVLPVVEVFRDNKDLKHRFAENLDTESVRNLLTQDQHYFEREEHHAKLEKVTALMEQDRIQNINDVNRGMALLNAGNYDQAISLFQKTVDQGGDLGEALFLIAKAFGEQQKYDKMKRSGLKMLLLNPRDPRGYKILGLAYYYTGNLPAGEQFLTRARFLEHNLITWDKL